MAPAAMSTLCMGVWNGENQTKQHDQEDFFHKTLFQPTTERREVHQCWFL
jgi:hypothetical protein